MRAAIVLLYAALVLNLAAGVAGAIVLPEAHPVVRALGAAIARSKSDELPDERVADDSPRFERN